MDKEYFLALAKVRMERAKELLVEAKELLNRESYKSANNRAFYAIEKSVKALLATEQIEVTTHNGGLKHLPQMIIRKLHGQNKFVMRPTMMIFMWRAKKRPDSRLKVLTIL